MLYFIYYILHIIYYMLYIKDYIFYIIYHISYIISYYIYIPVKLLWSMDANFYVTYLYSCDPIYTIKRY